MITRRTATGYLGSYKRRARFEQEVYDDKMAADREVRVEDYEALCAKFNLVKGPKAKFSIVGTDDKTVLKSGYGALLYFGTKAEVLHASDSLKKIGKINTPIYGPIANDNIRGMVVEKGTGISR